MMNRLKTALKIIAIVVVVVCIVFGAIYLELTIPSERELWRIKDNNLEDPIVVNNLLLFKGHKGEFLHSWCEYIYAVDKNTGKTVWSSEGYTTDQYCSHSSGPVYTAIILLAKEDTILISSTYWTIGNDEQEFVLYALDHATGELIWEMAGYAGYPYSRSALLDYTIYDTDYVYVASREGLFSAIDPSNGKQIWKQSISTVDYTDNIHIEYYDQVVSYYESGKNSITAFDARDGRQIWEISSLDFVEQILYSEQLMYLITSSYQFDGNKYPTVGHPPFDITVLNTKTGAEIWTLSFWEKFSPRVEIVGDKVYVLTYDSEGMFDDFKVLRRLVVVKKETGDQIWEFNKDYSHGDLIYLVQNDVIYISTYDNYLFALDNNTGISIWQAQSPCFPYDFYIEGNTFVAICEEKYVFAFDTVSGVQKWVVDVGMEKYWYPREFILVDNGVVYVSGPTSGKVYALDIETGDELWTWNHWHPRDKAYMIKALDNDILYVDQYRRFLEQDWFFALKAQP